MSLNDWRVEPIGNFADVKGGKRLPLDRDLIPFRTNHPYIRLVDVADGRINRADVLYLDNETHKSISRYIVNTHDVCLAIVGHTIGMVFLVEDEWDGANLTENAARITNFDRSQAIPEYIFHYLNSSVGQQAIKARIVGSAQGKLPLYNIKSIHIPLPPLEEQRAIAHILGSLDDKIELNRQMNATLEATAWAIFKSWFVDFDPVHAKANGEQPGGMDAEIAALFPNSFEDGELGLIPRGWEVAHVGDEFSVTMGQSPPGETYNEDGIGTPFYQGRRDFGFRYPSKRVYCTDPTRLAQTGDTLVSVRAPVGDVNMAIEDCCIGRGVAAIRHKSGSRSFTYYSMQFLKAHFENFDSEGTVFGSINGKDFREIAIVQPTVELIAEFERALYGLDESIENNERQIMALAANESAVQVLGDQQLAFIAHELLKSVRESVTIDWTVKQNARAKIRVLVKRILRKYGYPPDLQEAATETVLEQAELLAAGWAT